LQAGILLVAVHISETVQLPHLCEDSRSPFHQVLEVFALNRVLILRVALPASDAQVLPGLQKCHRARDSGKLRPQTTDDFARADFPLVQRLQRGINKTAVSRAIAADESDRSRDCRIGFDRVTDLQRCVLHDLK